MSGGNGGLRAEKGPPWLPWPKTFRADGKNIGSYPDKKAPRVQWAWEFLRRNTEYQNDYQRYLLLPQGFDWNALPLEMWALTTPPALPGETLPQWDTRIEDAGVKHRSARAIAAQLCGKWSVHEMVDPAASKPPQFALGHVLTFADHGSPVFEEDAVNLRQYFRSQTHLLHLLFDIHQPFDVQVDQARGVFEAYRNAANLNPFVTKRNRRWGCYLMVLDSKARGFSDSKAAKMISAAGLVPHIKGRKRVVFAEQISKWREEANEIACGDYRLIVDSQPSK